MIVILLTILQGDWLLILNNQVLADTIYHRGVVETVEIASMNTDIQVYQRLDRVVSDCWNSLTGVKLTVLVIELDEPELLLARAAEIMGFNTVHIDTDHNFRSLLTYSTAK